MIDEEYTSRLLNLLRYVPYCKEENSKTQRFSNQLLISFEDRVEFDKPRSLEEAIRKLKNYYEQSNNRYKTKLEWKGNLRRKGKW